MDPNSLALKWRMNKSELLCCESQDQSLVFILIRPKDEFYSSSIFCGGITLYCIGTTYIMESSICSQIQKGPQWISRSSIPDKVPTSDKTKWYSYPFLKTAMLCQSVLVDHWLSTDFHIVLVAKLDLNET